MLPRDRTVRIFNRTSLTFVLINTDVTGELIRENVVESQEGVPLYMDIQVIDTNTCNPLPNIYMDIWHCNATVSLPISFRLCLIKQG